MSCAVRIPFVEYRESTDAVDEAVTVVPDTPPDEISDVPRTYVPLIPFVAAILSGYRVLVNRPYVALIPFVDAIESGFTTQENVAVPSVESTLNAPEAKT
jgi:hypothetical protein